jgi:hypothetical protein
VTVLLMLAQRRFGCESHSLTTQADSISYTGSASTNRRVEVDALSAALHSATRRQWSVRANQRHERGRLRSGQGCGATLAAIAPRCDASKVGVGTSKLGVDGRAMCVRAEGMCGLALLCPMTDRRHARYDYGPYDQNDGALIVAREPWISCACIRIVPSHWSLVTIPSRQA